MKSVVKINMLIGALFVFSLCEVNAQIASDSSVVTKEYDDLGEALKNPSKVYRLNLSNQNFTSLSDSIWIKFENLEYLSLKNDHLEEIPFGIGNLKNLKILDLSNNDFEVLPKSFSRLKNLREIYLNGEEKMDINQALRTIKKLPNLKILHLENDNLESIPQSLLRLTHLETLYLNNNNFKEIPIELRKLKNLNYLDFHGNKFRINNPDFQLQYQGSGIILNF
jgi:Leucine-rich repeat (LRR) protein